MSSLHRQKGRPNWFCAYRGADGKQHFNSTGTSNKAEAQLICDKIGHGARHARKRSLTPDRRAEAGYFYRSDHFNFAKAGVPALYIKSGTQLRDKPEGAGKALLDDYLANRYHKPGDEYSEDWDMSGTVEDLRLLFEVGARVASEPTWPAWRAGNEFRPAREKSAKSREPERDDD